MNDGMEGPVATYSRRQLLDLHTSACSKSKTHVTCLWEHGLLRYRGTRGGVRCARPRPVLRLRPVNNGAYIVHSTRRPRPSRRGTGSVKSNIIPVRILRHTESPCHVLRFGSMNVQSLSSTKVDSLLIEIRQRPIDVLLLCETWHDADSVSIRRLRAEGYSVIERARPRSRQAEASLAVNHGGVAVVATAGVKLTAINTGAKPSTFECVAVRVTAGTSSYIILLVYRPGSAAITDSFFAELSDVLDRLSTYVDPLLLAGDINIRLERTADRHTVVFRELLDSYGLVQRVQDVTHDAGGTIDVVCSRGDLPSPSVDVHEIGLSDHRLLCWTSPFCRSDPVNLNADRRPWRLFSLDAFLCGLQASALCDEQQFQQLDGLSLIHI